MHAVIEPSPSSSSSSRARIRKLYRCQNMVVGSFRSWHVTPRTSIQQQQTKYDKYQFFIAHLVISELWKLSHKFLTFNGLFIITSVVVDRLADTQPGASTSSNSTLFHPTTPEDEQLWHSFFHHPPKNNSPKWKINCTWTSWTVNRNELTNRLRSVPIWNWFTEAFGKLASTIEPSPPPMAIVRRTTSPTRQNEPLELHSAVALLVLGQSKRPLRDD